MIVPKSAGTLLIHLCAGGNTIDGHKKKLLRLNRPKQMFDVVEYLNEHFLLCHPERGAVAVVVRAVVDDTIHVKLHLSASPFQFTIPDSGARRDCRTPGSGFRRSAAKS